MIGAAIGSALTVPFVATVTRVATGSLGGVGIGDITTLASVVGGVLAAAFLFVKAGPAWNTSLLKQARDRAADLSQDLDAAERRRDDAEQKARATEQHADERIRAAEEKAWAAQQRAERYLSQLRAGHIIPFDKEADQ